MNIDKIKTEIDEIKDGESIWKLFGFLKKLLKDRGLVRTGNIVGERGEFLAIEIYNNTPNMPTLQAAPEGTQNIDVISRKGERYAIKTVTAPGKTTGVFHGLGSPDDSILPNQKFEYLIIVIINKDFELELMLEMEWSDFLKNRKWHSTMKAWNISLTKAVIENSKIIYKK